MQNAQESLLLVEVRAPSIYRNASFRMEGSNTMALFHCIVTHSGPFHADDVLAVAVLSDLEPSARVIRTRDSAILDAARQDPNTVLVDVGWSYDVALRNFDHHQQSFRERRANGVPFASIGLVWEVFGDRWLLEIMEVEDDVERQRVFASVDEDLIASVDAFDCGVVEGTHKIRGQGAELRVPSVADVIGSFNPSWFETPDFDLRFHDAVRVASGLLRRQAWRALGEVRFQAVVDEHDDGSAILELPVAGPWRRYVKPHHLVVVFPAVGEDGWLAQAVGDPASTSFPPPLRIAYPARWRGQSPDELARETGVSDTTFCHRAGFIAGAASRDGARRLAELLVEHGERP